MEELIAKEGEVELYRDEIDDLYFLKIDGHGKRFHLIRTDLKDLANLMADYSEV